MRFRLYTDTTELIAASSCEYIGYGPTMHDQRSRFIGVGVNDGDILIAIGGESQLPSSMNTTEILDVRGLALRPSLLGGGVLDEND